jgi:hypothetical protein
MICEWICVHYRTPSPLLIHNTPSQCPQLARSLSPSASHANNSAFVPTTSAATTLIPPEYQLDPDLLLYASVILPRKTRLSSSHLVSPASFYRAVALFFLLRNQHKTRQRPSTATEDGKDTTTKSKSPSSEFARTWLMRS